MRRLTWITDPHLNFLHPVETELFFRAVADKPSDAILLSGDIGEAPNVCRLLDELDTAVQRPVYFVLGNHDFYRGSLAGVRNDVRSMCRACPNLHWLPDAGVVTLTQDTCLVGHDGWGDGRYGDYWNSPIELNDWGLIEDFTNFGKKGRFDRLNALGDEAAAHFRSVLPDALQGHRHVIVVTHVPPFEEACWHEGRISDDNWLPHFTCKAVGEVLREAMEAAPDRQMTVLCGHTHGEGEAQILPNLLVLTGGTVYGRPKVQRVIEVG